MKEVFIASYIALWILVLVLTVGVVALYHHFGEMYLTSRDGRAAQGPEVGNMLKRSVRETVAGKRLELPVVGLPSLILFADTTCRLCGNLRPDFRRFVDEQHEVDLVVVCGGPEDAVREWSTGLAEVVPVIPDAAHRLSVRYRVGMTPYLVAVDGEGVVRAKGLINDGTALAEYAEAIGSNGRKNAVGDRVEVSHD